MTKIVWNPSGERFFEVGVDRGVLYVSKDSGVPWNGLTSINQAPVGGENQAFYIDGVKYINVSTREEFAGSIEAYTYPDEFSACDGTLSIGTGLLVDQQVRLPFDFTYRTKIGNDVEGVEHGYKIHIVYNALVAPTSKTYSSLRDTIDPLAFSWTFTTTPVIVGPSLRPTSHFVIDSRKVKPSVLRSIEDRLYGTETTLPEMIPPGDLLDFFPSLKVVDNGDGTWTATGNDREIQYLDKTTFKITSSGAEMITEDTYTLSSVED